MRFTVREPATKTFMDIEAYPEDYKDSTAWRIQYPGQEPFLVVKQNEEWTILDQDVIDIEIAEAVIEGLQQRTKNSGQ